MLKAAWSVTPICWITKCRTMPDLPQLESAFVEINEPQSAYGQSHWGEPPIIPVAAAIRNAVEDGYRCCNQYTAADAKTVI